MKLQLHIKLIDGSADEIEEESNAVRVSNEALYFPDYREVYLWSDISELTIKPMKD